MSDQHKRKTFNRGQRKRYEDSCAFLSYSDEAMRSQLKPATMQMLLPRGCRTLAMELFGLMVLTVTAAQLGWSVTRGFNEAMQPEDWTTGKLTTITEQIDRDDPSIWSWTVCGQAEALIQGTHSEQNCSTNG